MRPNDARLKPLRDLYDKYHPWTPPSNRADWEQQAERIRQQVLVGCGLWPMPEKQPLEPVVHSLVDRGDYTIERVYFASRPGLYVTGSLYRPKHVEGKVPGILCPHGHWANGRFYDSGKGAAQQLEIGAESYLSGAHYPLQARMVQLCRMGCVVFHYDMIGYADNQPLVHREGFNDPEAVLWLENKLGLQTWNSIRAVDFITSLPDVDAARIAVTGASGGGTQTFMLCAVDPRPAVAFPAVMVSTNMQGGCVCENADYLRIDINNIALAALFAPKPMAMSGADDWTIDIETKGLPELKQIYSLYGNADLVDARAFPQFKHNYNQVSREMMFNWMNEHLGLGQPAPVKQSDFWPLTQEEMTVFDDKHPLPSDALSALELRKLLTEANRRWYAGLLDKSRENPGAYRDAILPAARVMLGESVLGKGEAKATPLAKSLPDGYVFHKGICSRGDRGTAIPTAAAVLPDGFNGRAVLWLDGTGKSAVFNADGTPVDGVRAVVDDGYALISADLFLTGEYIDSEGGENVLEYKVNENYPGLTYAYNRPLLAERVQDVLTLIEAIRQLPRIEELHLVGTGEAGVWVLLARALADKEAVQSTTIDTQGFAFRQIDSPQDPNLLPGALKYGGLGGLAALAFPAPLNVFGVTTQNAAEIKPLQDIYAASSKDQLQIHEANLTPTKVVETFTR